MHASYNLDVSSQDVFQKVKRALRRRHSYRTQKRLRMLREIANGDQTTLTVKITKAISRQRLCSPLVGGQGRFSSLRCADFTLDLLLDGDRAGTYRGMAVIALSDQSV
jgi:hypothetical protein